jgi:coatomer protein complex subunit epsilon
MYRTDYAERQLKTMQQIDEDHTLTQLANAWVNLALGGAKVQEAYYIFQELCEKYTWTVMLMNGSAVCQMHMGHFEEAETRLLEALNKDPKDANTLANLIVCNLHLGKATTRFMSQLKISHPNHTLVERAAAGEASFDRAVQSVA